MLKPLICLMTLAPGLGAAQTITLTLPEPGYLVIDGSYYGYGLRSPASTSNATLRPLGSDGFHFQTLLDFGGCTRANGAALTTVQAGQGGLSVADTSARPTGLVFALASGSGSQLTLGACRGANVVFARTVDGDSRCSSAITRPIARGPCPGVDAADPSFVFFDAFETFAVS